MNSDIKPKTPEEMKRLGEVFRELILKNAIEFSTKNVDELPSFVRFVLSCVVTPFNINYSLGNISIDDHFCLKLSDDMIGYLVVGPANYMFCNSDHSDSIDGKAVLAHFFKTYQGIDVSIKGDEVFFYKDGLPITIPK